MSRATMSTSTQFGSADDSGHQTQVVKPLKVAILGDFSGRASRGISEPSSIGGREAFRLTKDTFHRVFDAMEIRLQMPFVEQPIALMDFDDLHPDYIYSRVPLFKEFISLQKRLLTPGQFESAANEIMDLSTYQHEEATGQVDQLIKGIVAPYIEPKDDPRQDKLLEAVNSATSETMRKLMHNSAFQQIEASWRSLHLLTKRLDANPYLQIDLLDISKQELLEDFFGVDGDLESSQTFKRLVSSKAVAGDSPYNVILGDFYLEDNESDLALIIDMGTIAEAVGATFLSGASTKLAGCPTLAGSSDPDDWYYPLKDEFKSAWQAVREYSASAHVALSSPRFLLRLPYGAATSTTDCFDFEELAKDSSHKYYLWGNSAYLILLNLCDTYNKQGMDIHPQQLGVVDNLPLHVYKASGSQQIKPCAENLLTDVAAKRFLGTGLSLVRSIQDSDSVHLHVTSLHESGELYGPWSKMDTVEDS